VRLDNNISRLFTGLALCAVLAAPSAIASITDFTNWTQVEDPPHDGMTSVVNSSNAVTLTANGLIPSGTDIGYQASDKSTAAASTAGYYFSVSSDFSVAVDFALAFSDSVGAGAIGFGIGEDGNGANGAGIGLGFVNGAPMLVTAAARVNDVDQPITLLEGAPIEDSGRFFIAFNSANGDITYGISATPGSANPSHSGTLPGMARQWKGDDLLVSFFLRSQEIPILSSALSTGRVEAVFSNFTVLAGAPISAGDMVDEGIDAFPNNPTESVDSDHDGMGDNFENAYGLNPNDGGDAGLDPDDDGKTNLEEFQLGTNPWVHNGKTATILIINDLLLDEGK